MARMRAWKSSRPSCRTYMTVFFSSFLDSDERLRCKCRIQLPWHSSPTSGCSCCALDFHSQQEATPCVPETCRALRLQLCPGVYFLAPWLPFQPPPSVYGFCAWYSDPAAPLQRQESLPHCFKPGPSCPWSLLKTGSNRIGEMI